MPKSLNTGQNRSEFRIAIDEAVTIQLKLDLFSWASLLSHFRLFLIIYFLFFISLIYLFYRQIKYFTNKLKKTYE